MNKLLLFSAALFLAGIAVGETAASADDAIRKQILTLFPQADTNQDGIISDSEEAVVCRQALKRFPQADRDRNGVLSDQEKQSLLRAIADRTANAAAGRKRQPSHREVSYGEHERQVFDIWLASSTEPTPLAIYIHGGGFKGGSKENLDANVLSELLSEGISVAAINYRYATTAPLPAAHHDARRALQFMRSRADGWNIDTQRVAAFGGSAGAQICMWLAFTGEMAEPESDDPIRRESTRLTCVATKGGQTSNSIDFYRQWIEPLMDNGQKIESLSRPLGKITNPEKVRMATWGAKSLEEANATASRHSALSIISSDDPPIFMSYGMSPDAPRPRERGRVRGWLIHHVNFGIALKKKTDPLGVEAHLKYPGSKSRYESEVEFFRAKLLEK